LRAACRGAIVVSMNDQAPRIRLIGRPGSPQAYAIRDFLHRNDIPSCERLK